MAHALVRPDRLQGDHFLIDGPEAHHLVRVLRRTVGDEVDLFDGVNRRCRGVITAVDPAAPSAQGRIIAELQTHAGNHRLRLYQGLPKGPKIDFVIEKAIELGVDMVVPFMSDRCMVKVDGPAASAKVARWKRLAEAASKQCERPDVPAVLAPVKFDELPDHLHEGVTLVFSVRPGVPALKSLLRSQEAWSSFAGDSSIINLVVGPESGLIASEEDHLAAAGARLVSLGARVLRTETAGLAALAILQHELNTDEK